MARDARRVRHLRHGGFTTLTTADGLGSNLVRATYRDHKGMPWIGTYGGGLNLDDESHIRPYFELDNVLRNGVFYAAHKLYGLTFTERHDLPVYHPEVS